MCKVPVQKIKMLEIHPAINISLTIFKQFANNLFVKWVCVYG